MRPIWRELHLKFSIYVSDTIPPNECHQHACNVFQESVKSREKSWIKKIKSFKLNSPEMKVILMTRVLHKIKMNMSFQMIYQTECTIDRLTFQ